MGTGGKAQDLKAAEVREDREHQQHSAIIQDIYVHEKHGQERHTTYPTPAPIRSQTPSLTNSPQRVSSTVKKRLQNTRSVPTPDFVIILNIASLQQISIQRE